MIPRIRSLHRAALAAWASLVVVLIAFKSFVSAVSAWRFERELAPADVACSFGGDALLCVLLLAAVLGLRNAVRAAERAPVSTTWARLRHRSARVALIAVTGAIVVMQVVYLLCAYVFWEWGWFLEPPHLDAGRMAGVTAEVFEYVSDRKMLLVALTFASTLGLSVWLARRLRWPAFRRRVVVTMAGVCAALALGAFAPLARPGAFDPSVPSPLLVFASGFGETSGGLDPEVWPAPPRSVSVALPPARPVPEEWQDLAGRARDLDCVIVVLESTRRDRLGAYGCARGTTPNLDRLAAQALVLDEAYVAQPRSCKTMESLVLGTYPDPRQVSLAWSEPPRALGDSLLARLAPEHRLYFGTSFARETDDFDRFVERAAGRPLERNVGADELGQAVRPHPMVYDDRVLVDDFLRWREDQEGACSAILWLAGSHHPYRAIELPFGEEELLDRYDNTVWCSDRAVGRLVEGLRSRGRAEQTLLVILGDHGEALGEQRDILHGSFLYDHSIRIPCLLWNPGLFPEQRRCAARFSVKDLAATLLWLRGDERPLGQSHVLFGNRRDDPLFFSNVYQDFKLGRLAGDVKLTWRPERDELRLHDLAADPAERFDRGSTLDLAERRRLRDELIAWYWFQLGEVEARFPAAPRAE